MCVERTGGIRVQLSNLRLEPRVLEEDLYRSLNVAELDSLGGVFPLLKLNLAFSCNGKEKCELEPWALPQMQESGCWFYTSWRPQGTDCKHMVVDNSEAIHKVGIAIEFCGNKSQFKSDMLLIPAVPRKGLISMVTVSWGFSITC